nr:hypothetical protein CFP56_52766 [Quercus suber]
MTSSGLGIQYPGITHQPRATPATSTFDQETFPTYSIEGDYSNAPSPPEIRAPKPRRPYTTIAPNPAGISTNKRRRDEDEQGESSVLSDKRRKRTSSLASADLSEDDRFLVQLKDDEGLPWKDISTRFQTDKGQTVRVATLQMRYKRLREKFRVWEEVDMNALKLAHDYWEKYKWEIISAKVNNCLAHILPGFPEERRPLTLALPQMTDYGVSERWPARHCARKWQDVETSLVLSHATTSAAIAAGITPALSQFSSPVDAPVHFAFMPLQ